jgi:hypothetical protein
VLLLSFAAGVSRSRMRGCTADKRIRSVFVIPCVCIVQVVAKITQQLQLASALPDGVEVFDLFANAHAHADATVISNCTFKNNRARCAAAALAWSLTCCHYPLTLPMRCRGILLKGHNIVVDGNTFDGCTGACLGAPHAFLP